MEILIEETKIKYGYDVSSLKPNSEKLVVSKCIECGTIKDRKFRAAKKHLLCHRCASTISSRNSIAQRAEHLKKRHKEGSIVHPMLGKTHSKETREKISKSRTGKITSEETKEKLRLIFSGSGNPFYGKHHKESSKRYGKQNSRYGKSPGHTKKVWYEKDGKKVCFRSTWEFKVAEYLDKNSISWEYESHVFEVEYTVDNKLKESTYRTDFYIADGDYFIEVKGLWRPGYREKFEACEKIIPQKIHLWDHKKLKELKIL